ncbi:MAG: hypothetical protein ACLUFN_04350 [Eubacterium sp.]
MKKVVMLKHISCNNDIKILGFFYKKNIVDVISFYMTLSGFSDARGQFDYSKEICTDVDYVYLLQIWDKSDEDYSIVEKIYTNEKSAKDFLYNYKLENTNEYQIEKYSIGEKYWIEGFISV